MTLILFFKFFDTWILDLYDKYIASIPEVFKWLLLIILLVVIVLGLISLIRKTFKFSIFILILILIGIVLMKA